MEQLQQSTATLDQVKAAHSQEITALQAEVEQRRREATKHEATLQQINTEHAQKVNTPVLLMCGVRYSSQEAFTTLGGHKLHDIYSPPTCTPTPPHSPLQTHSSTPTSSCLHTLTHTFTSASFSHPPTLHLSSQLSDLHVSHLEALHHQQEQLEAQVSLTWTNTVRGAQQTSLYNAPCVLPACW